MKTRFSDEQIIRIFRKVEAGVSARERCDRHAISDAIFYVWCKRFGGRIITSVVHIQQWIIRRHQSLQQGAEGGNLTAREQILRMTVGTNTGGRSVDI
ncbi:transposase [Pantoea sp. SJZ147]|nr:transposase [Pantoea sp. SJZ147]